MAVAGGGLNGSSQHFIFEEEIQCMCGIDGQQEKQTFQPAVSDDRLTVNSLYIAGNFIGLAAAENW